jgi:hypothetical protein
LPVGARERHGALELLWSLKLDVNADVVWEAAGEQVSLLFGCQIAGVGQPGLEGFDVLIDE